MKEYQPEQRIGSCNINAFPSMTDCEGNLVKKQEASTVKTIEEQNAEILGVTPAKLQAMKEYAALLRRMDSKIKKSTVRRKVCEKFKIKLV